jgi:hypothetical protein
LIIKYASALIAVVYVLGAPPGVQAQNSVDVVEISKELSRATPDLDATTSVMWMPAEFWALMASMNGSTAEDLAEIRETLKPFNVFVATDGTYGVFGGTKAKPASEIRASIRLVMETGKIVSPLDLDNVGSDMKSFVNSFIPAFLTEAVGDEADDYVTVVFPRETESGETIADPTSEGSFAIVIGERIFRWRTPIAGFVPPKYCPIDGEAMSGAWKFCPWHGAELEERPPE